MRVATLTYEEFCRVEEAWDDLALDAEVPIPFLCHTWLRLWWKHFGAGQAFQAIVVDEGQRLCAAAPIAIRRGSPALDLAEIVGTGPVPTRGMGLADKVDLLVRRGDPAAGQRLAAEVVKLLERVDLLDVKGLDAGSPSLAWLTAATPRAGAVRTVRRSVSPYLVLSTPWEAYLRSRSRNFRKQLKKQWRMLEQAGSPAIAPMGQGADPAEWMQGVFAVDAASWQAQRGTNLFRAPSVRAFFAELLPELAARGRLDLHMIRLDGAPAAYEICFDFDGRLFSYNGAYRKDIERASPGTTLTAAVIESACARGYREYDMLRGPESYKMRWSETARTELQLLLPSDRRGATLKTLLGPWLKARLQQWPWLVERADRLSGLASRVRHRG